MQLWWAFGPGSVHLVGDFLPRNHANRDVMFGASEEEAEAKSETTLKQVLMMVQVRQCARDIAMKGLVDGPVKWAGFPEDSLDPEAPSAAALSTRGGFMVQATSSIDAAARPLRTATGRRLAHAV